MQEKIYRNSWKYPCGMQTFSDLRERGCVYVDKTDMVYEMTKSKYVFLNRPRRFGKSLLCSTLASYFEGRKDLFEGLKIMELEKELKKYPVLQFSISSIKDMHIDQMASGLGVDLGWYEETYGAPGAEENTPGKRLKGLIRRARQQAGMQQGKDHLKDLATLEAFYQRDLYTFFSGMSAQVQCEVMMAEVRVDAVIRIGDKAFVCEFKVNGSAQSALDQIDRNRYYDPWRPIQRQIIKIGAYFDIENRTLKDWIMEEG